MAQQLINYGAFPDDANADAIRTAFLKVEQNFTDLYNNGVSGVTSVNSGQGVIARRSGSNVFVSANVYQLQVASAANSMVFTLGTTTANTAIYSQGSDTLTINPAENFGVTNVYVSGNMYMQGAPVTAPFVTRLPDSTATFTGNGVGLYGIILRPTKLIGTLNQIQYVSTDDFGKPIIVGSNNFTYDSVTNQLLMTGRFGESTITMDGTLGTISTTNEFISNISFTNTLSNTYNLIVRNESSFLGNASFDEPITANGNVTITNITPATAPGTGALVVVGGTSVGANFYVGGNSSLGGNVIVSGSHTVVGTVAGGNLVSTGNITASGNSVVSGNSSVVGTLNVGNATYITGITTINNSLAVLSNVNIGGETLIAGNANIARDVNVLGNSRVSGNANINGRINITPNVAITTQVIYANGTTLSGSANFTWNNSTRVLTLIGDDYTGPNTSVLQISGGAELSGSFYVGGQAFIGTINANTVNSNNSSISGNLSVTGNISAAGTTTQVLYNNNGNIAAASGLTYDTSGNVTISNSLDVAGNTIITGDTDITGALGVSGNTTLGAQVNATQTGANAFFVNGQANINSIIGRNLTPTRIVFTDANSQLVDNANLTFLGTLLSINGDVTATGNSDVSGNAIVGGNSTITGSATVNGNFSVTTGNAAISTGNLLVAGNILTAANLNVNENAIIAGNLVIEGSNGIQAVGNISTDGNISAIGNITGNSNIIAVGNVSANNATVTNNISAASANISSTANILGATALGNTLAVTGAVTLNNTLAVTANATFSANASVGANLVVTGNTILTGNYTAKGSDTQVQYNNNGNVTGASSLLYTVANGYVQMTANAQVGGNLSITASASVGGNLTITGNSATTGNAVVTGNSSANNISVTNTVTLANISAQGSEIAVRSAANLFSTLYTQTTANIRGALQVGSSITMEGTNILTTRAITTGNSTTTGTMTGNWTLSGRFESTYADLAENYASDADYMPGTVVEFGGSQEVTIASFETTRLAGVVTTEPAYVLNSSISCTHPVRLALVGRVPVRVTGYVHKGDMLVSAGNGVAKACAHPIIGQVIGKALQDFVAVGDNHIGIVEAAISRH